MSFSEFVSFWGNAFTLFFSTITEWGNSLVQNYYVITILAVGLFFSFCLFFLDIIFDIFDVPLHLLSKTVDEPDSLNFLYAEQNNLKNQVHQQFYLKDVKVHQKYQK